MKLKVYMCLCLFLLTVVGCSTNNEKKGNEVRKEEETAPSTVQVGNESEENQEMTMKVKDEEGVLNGQVYTQDDVAIGTLVLDKSVSDEDAKKLAEKYAKEIKEEYQDTKVNVQAVRDGENVVNITLE